MHVKHADRVKSLTADQVRYLWAAVLEDPADSTELFLQRCEETGLTQLELVMALRTDITPIGCLVLEALIAKPIARRAAADAFKKAPKVNGNVHARPARSVDERTITFVKPNAKKPGSAAYDRYNLYEVGMTITEFVKRGGTMGDVRWDLDKGNIQVSS